MIREDPGKITRRTFLAGAVVTGIAACTKGTPKGPTSTKPFTTVGGPKLASDPFTLGVASGDPLPGGVVLWTRLAIEDPTADVLMPEVDVPLRWEVSTDEGFSKVAHTGEFIATPAHAHCAHIDVDGLDAGRDYWYRFRTRDHTSAIGHTRTAPPLASSPKQLNFAVASCQAYRSGFYTPYAQMATEDLDAIFFLGDFIYEIEASQAARPHDLPIPTTLDEYRRLYALAHSDENLQLAQASAPWIGIWDDHEVEDNYAALKPGRLGIARDKDAEKHFPSIRKAAYQAWWENNPIRSGPPNADGSLKIFRSFSFGDLAFVAALDERQYRSAIVSQSGAGDLPRPAGGGSQPAEAFDPDRTMLGADQEKWLHETLGGSSATWNLLAQQSLMTQCDRLPEIEGVGFSMDSWDGYVAARNRLLADVGDLATKNLVVLTGDIHASAIADLYSDYQDPNSPIVGTELVAPSISSIELISDEAVAGALANPGVHLYDPVNRGYLQCTLTPQNLRASFKYVVTTLEPSSEPLAGTSWEVLAGTPGARSV